MGLNYCDILYWNDSDVRYTFFGGSCTGGLACGSICSDFHYTTSYTYWNLGASFILYYDCDYLVWVASAVFYALVGVNCYHGSLGGSFALDLSISASATTWLIGAYLILFYDCDYLYWLDSTIYYAFIGGTCIDISGCGFTILALNNIALFTFWHIGASKL